MGFADALREWFRKEMWTIDVATLPRPRRVLLYLVRALFLALRGVFRPQFAAWSAALTYTTLMSLVPFLAVVIGVGLKLGVPQRALDSITEKIPEGQAQIINQAIEGAKSLDFKALGAVAALLLLYTAVKVLTTVERAFNEIWGVPRGRSFLKRVTGYVTVSVIGPLLVFSGLALSASLMSSRVMTGLEEQTGGVVEFAVRLFPYVAVGLALAAIYWVMPNTKVRMVPALTGALVASVLWQIVQYGFLWAQVGVSRMGVVYGALAAIPIFLFWVYLSWTIVQVGALVAYGTQHAATFAVDLEEGEASQATVERTALRIAVLLASRFEGGEKPLEADEVSSELGAPGRLVNRLLARMERDGLVVALENGHYQVAKSPRVLTAADVVSGLRESGAELPIQHDVPEGAVRRIDDVAGKSLAALEVPLADLI